MRHDFIYLASQSPRRRQIAPSSLHQRQQGTRGERVEPAMLGQRLLGGLSKPSEQDLGRDAAALAGAGQRLLGPRQPLSGPARRRRLIQR